MGAFIDIAANLTDDMFKGIYHLVRQHQPDIPMVLERAREAGVFRILVTAGSVDMAKEALTLARQSPHLFSTVGIHPTRCNIFGEYTDSHWQYIAQLKEIAEHSDGKVVAVGECGLDYDRLSFCDKKSQITGFKQQFLLAEQLKLPMLFHNRNTQGDFVRIVQQRRSQFKDGVVHSFTGDSEELKQLIDLGLYIGVNGCSLKTEDNVKVAKMIPLERLLLETDCPYCEIRKSHVGHSWIKSYWKSAHYKKYESGVCVKGRTEPCHIRQVAEILANLHEISVEDIARQAFMNTMKVFFLKSLGQYLVLQYLRQ
eukprot:jgi/Galph1/5287/GphlegSOOS_G3950.1